MQVDVCPCCSYPLLRHIRSGRLFWFCSHCHQEYPFGIAIDVQGGMIDPYTVESKQIQLNQLKAEKQLEWEKAQLLQAQRDAVEHLNRLKEEFVSTVSHELRTPLSNMKTGLQVLEYILNKQGDSSADVDRYLTVLKQECDREIQLINDLLMIQQVKAHGYTLLPIHIPLQEWIPSVVEVFEELAQKHQVEFQVNIPTDLPSLYCDLTLLDRILQEFLTNACKFTPPGEQIAIAAQAYADRMEISVTNSGVEIPQEQIAHVFDMLYRSLQEDDQWQHNGIGLGLTLAQTLATELGGSIWVNSTAMQTCFTLELPCPADRSVTTTDLLMSYIAYYISRGRELISPMAGELSFTGSVYQYWGYRPEFLLFWKQLQSRHDFRELYFKGDLYSFGCLLEGQCSVRECARCRLPIQHPEAGQCLAPECPCDDKLMQISAAVGSNATVTQVLVIGSNPPDQPKNWRELFLQNRLNVAFVPKLDQILPDDLRTDIDIVLISGVSQDEERSLVRSLQYYPKLQRAEVIALTPHAKTYCPWSERSPSIEDCLLSPYGGDYLVQYLRRIHRDTTELPEKELFWLPI